MSALNDTRECYVAAMDVKAIQAACFSQRGLPVTTALADKVTQARAALDALATELELLAMQAKL